MKPLDGLRILDLTRVLAGPFATAILADLGAEVIKVEPPGGDKTRKLPGLGIGFFRSFNRNKKSIVLDITTEAGRATVGSAPLLAEGQHEAFMTRVALLTQEA